MGRSPTEVTPAPTAASPPRGGDWARERRALSIVAHWREREREREGGREGGGERKNFNNYHVIKPSNFTFLSVERMAEAFV